MRWKLFKLKWKARWLKFNIDYYDALVAFSYRDFNNPSSPIQHIPAELLSENAPPEYQELCDEYYTVLAKIAELQDKIKQQ